MIQQRYANVLRHLAKNKIDVNNAGIKEIKSIYGIGKILAFRIIEYRPYATLEDLRFKIKGIGEKRQSILKEVVSIKEFKKQKPKLVNHNRYISDAKKRSIAGKQYYKCANNPKNKLRRLENYKCPLWEKDNHNKGSFDCSGFEIDHIDEFITSRNNSEENLQALCKSCHSVKTRKFREIMHIIHP